MSRDLIMKKYLTVFVTLLLLGCSNSNPEPSEPVISEKDKLAFKRCASVVKGYGSHPEKFEYYPSESTNITNTEGREVVILSFAFGNAHHEKIYHKAECVIYPDGLATMTQMM